MKNFTDEQKKVAGLIQRDLAATESPFKIVADLCGLPEQDEIISMIRQFKQDGLLRKFGAILRHQKAGYQENALVVWSVPAEQTEKTGNTFAACPFVSHCYQREPAFMTKYNIFTMIHSGEKNIASLINQMADAAGINDYLILKSVKEYKKTSPEYFE